MKKSFTIILFFIASMSIASARTEFKCEANYEGPFGTDFSHLSIHICNNYRSYESCRGDFRCVPVETKIVRKCESTRSDIDADSGYRVRYLSNGTVQIQD